MLTYIFILSGLVLAVLLMAKRVEEKRRKNVFILNLISRGDVHVRELHHKAVNYYSLGKEKGIFLVKKQLPRYSKSSLNKALALLEERLQKHFDNIRDSRLLKKSDGISEFFKNISEVEKGEGELHDDIYNNESNETTPEPAREPIIEVKFEITEPVVGEVSTVVETSTPEVKSPRVRKASTKRRLKIHSKETGEFV